MLSIFIIIQIYNLCIVTRKSVFGHTDIRKYGQTEKSFVEVASRPTSFDKYFYMNGKDREVSHLMPYLLFSNLNVV